MSSKKRYPTPEPKVDPNIPKDLWRGWYNPLTGITAPKLGI